ncbi:hypothetical protein BVG81_003520 [Haliangium sp. UPWRP_2]|nr:hypothetical protein BVG81_003520 [Haliangium sp. UPWRP_2]
MIQSVSQQVSDSLKRRPHVLQALTAAMLAVFALIPGRSDAEERRPIFLGPIRQDCADDMAARIAIHTQLERMGEEVNAAPPDLSPDACQDLGCAKKLRGVNGFLLGTQVLRDADRVASVRVWVADLLQDRVLMQATACRGCEQPEVLARLAASLIERLADALAPWRPRKEIRSCADRIAAAGTSPAQPASHDSTAGDRLALLLYGGAQTSSIIRPLRSALQNLGFQVTEHQARTAPDDPRRAFGLRDSSQPLLEVELRSDDKATRSTGLSDVIIRLSHGSQTLQTTLDCMTLSCSSAALPVLIQRNAAILLDAVVSFDTGADAGPLASMQECLPEEVCRAGPAASTFSAGVQAADGSGFVPPSSEQKRSCSYVPRARKIAGGIIVGLGLATAIPAIILLGTEGSYQATTAPCPIPTSDWSSAAPPLLCIQRGTEYRSPGGVLLGVGGGLVLAGALIAGVPAQPSNPLTQDAVCRK